MTRHPHSVSSEPIQNHCSRSSLLSTREERGTVMWRRGRTTLPHDIIILRRVPEIEFCHRSIVTRARQHILPVFIDVTSPCTSPVNKLYLGSAGVNRTVDTLLTFSEHSRRSTLKKASRGYVSHFFEPATQNPHNAAPSNFHI